MKLWHLAAILLVLGIGYVLISRPMVPSVSANQQNSVSNSLWSGVFTGLVAGGKSLFSDKASPPSAVDSAAVYKPGEAFDDYANGLFGPGTADSPTSTQ